jgi:hypothetical protein
VKSAVNILRFGLFNYSLKGSIFGLLIGGLKTTFWLITQIIPTGLEQFSDHFNTGITGCFSAGKVFRLSGHGCSV